MRKEYRMVITPAISPNKRHYIEDCLQNLGFNVWAGGSHTDMSSCDTAFYDDEELSQGMANEINILTKANRSQAEEIKRLREALIDISQYCDCEGPGCHYCEGDFHPPSVEAKIAQAALKEPEVKG